MEDHRTWLNSLLFWTLETKCEHESMGVTIQPIVQGPHYDQHVRSRCHAYENEIPKLGRTAAPPSPAMNSRRLIGDPPRLFRVILSRFRLRGNQLITGCSLRRTSPHLALRVDRGFATNR